MYAVATFLIVAVITVAFTKVSTGALMATGMPADLAAFQARSAFSGAGLFLIVMAITNKPVQRWLTGGGHRYIQRHLTPALAHHREELLVLSDDFAIQSVRLDTSVDEARSLRGLAHALPGVTVLAVRRDQEFLGEPPVDIDLVEGDELILYGHRLRGEEAS
jgi:hypothetical protein